MPTFLLNSCPHPLADNCSDLNSELQRVLTGLENVVCCRKKSSCSLSVAEVDRHIEQLTTASERCDLAIKVGPPHPTPSVWLSDHMREMIRFLSSKVLFFSNIYEGVGISKNAILKLGHQGEAGAVYIFAGLNHIREGHLINTQDHCLYCKNDHFIGSCETNSIELCHFSWFIIQRSEVVRLTWKFY